MPESGLWSQRPWIKTAIPTAVSQGRATMPRRTTDTGSYHRTCISEAHEIMEIKITSNTEKLHQEKYTTGHTSERFPDTTLTHAQDSRPGYHSYSGTMRARDGRTVTQGPTSKCQRPQSGPASDVLALRGEEQLGRRRSLLLTQKTLERSECGLFISGNWQCSREVKPGKVFQGWTVDLIIGKDFLNVVIVFLSPRECS